MTDAIDPSAHYRPCPDAIESRLGDETVILHLGSGTYFGLDLVGTEIWEALKAHHAMRPMDICNHVRSAFPDAPARVEDDVMRFLEQLAAHDLIQRS